MKRRTGLCPVGRGGWLMALTLLYSSQRGALRDACLRQVCALTAAWPDKRAILLVPEQTKMDVERDYLRLSGQSGLMMAEVLSFRRLAWRLLGEVGRQPLRPIDKIGQAMLLHRLMKEHQNQLHMLGFLADKPGFISQVSAAVGDLKRYQISGEQLRLAGAGLAEPSLQHKTEDLGCLLQHYDRSLRELGFCDAEDDLNRLSDILQILADQPSDAWPWPWQRLAWLKKTSVWISGFGELRDFTPQEDAILAGLAGLAENVVITAAADRVPFDRQSIDLGPDCFLPGRKTAWRLKQNYPELKLAAVRCPADGLYGLLAGAICSESGKTGIHSDDLKTKEAGLRLRLVQANGLDDELNWLAGEIRRLVQTEQYRYQDIALALCEPSGYAPRLRSVCREYDIPIFLDAERPLSGTPLMRFIVGLLDIGLTNWSRSALMTCLRSGLTPLTPSEIDRLENEWLARGLFRPDRLFNDQYYREYVLPVRSDSARQAAADDEPADGSDMDEDEADAGGSDDTADAGSAEPADPADLQELIRLRDAALLPLRQAAADLRRAPTGRAKCLALRRFLVDYTLPERIDKQLTDWMAAGDMEAAVALSQSWNELDRILDQLAGLAGDLPFSLQTFRDTLAAGMDSAASGVIPSALDQVGVGDLRRSMLRQPRILFLIGAAAAYLPPAPPPEGLLKDPDRQALSLALNRQLPSSARDRTFADAFNVYTLLTGSSDRLYLTAPDADTSPWFKHLADLYPDSLLVLPVHPSWEDARLNALHPAYRYSLAGMQNREQLPETERLGYAGIRRVLAEQGLPMPTTGKSRQPQNQLSPAYVRLLGGDPVVLSVSQLERYAACPFLHFSERFLALRDRPVWAPQATETGVLLHAVLERALHRLCQDLHRLDMADPAVRDMFWQNWLTEDLDESVSGWMAAAAEQDGLTRFFDDGLRASIGRRVERVAISTLKAVIRQYRQESFLPAQLEWSFGPSNQPLLLPVKGATSVCLRGTIDRTDRESPAGSPGSAGEMAGGGFRVVDYKSGGKKVDYDDLYLGLALQMPVYLAAYRQAYPACRPIDAAYAPMNRPVLTWQSGDVPSEDVIRKHLDREQGLRGMQMRSEDIERICRYSLSQAAVLAERMLAGLFPVEPVKRQGCRPPCDFCIYQAVCGFNADTGAYRRLQPLRCRLKADGHAISKKEEFVQRLREAFPDDQDSRPHDIQNPEDGT